MDNTKLHKLLSDIRIPDSNRLGTGVLGPSLFRVIGIDVVIVVDGAITGTVYYQFTVPAKVIYDVVQVSAGDLTVFRTYEGRELPEGKYIVTNLGRDIFAIRVR